MFDRNQLENLLFIDIETASIAPDYAGLSPRLQELWDKKAKTILRRTGEDQTPAELFSLQAGIFAEYGKVVCISCGVIHYVGDTPKFRLKSYFGSDEAEILKAFSEMVSVFTLKPGRSLCAHNGKEFDFPYLGRRYLINGLPIPKTLQLQGKKPWEINHVDTMELWKFGDYKSFTSLDLLCAILNVPSPKGDIDGSEVGRVFWEDKDYVRIKTYCENDVLATAQVVLRMCLENLIPEDAVERT